MWTRSRLCLALILAFLFAQLFSGLGIGILETSDSPVFMNMASEHAVFTKAFLAGPRPPLTSLIIKLAAGSARLFVALQWLIHICAWSLLAAFFYTRSRRRLVGLLLASWTLALGLAPQVQVWNFYVLSESLSLSCLPFLFVLLPYKPEATSRRRWLALAIVLVAVTLLKDVGAYLALALSGAIALASLGAAGLRGCGATDADPASRSERPGFRIFEPHCGCRHTG